MFVGVLHAVQGKDANVDTEKARRGEAIEIEIWFAPAKFSRFSSCRCCASTRIRMRCCSVRPPGEDTSSGRSAGRQGDGKEGRRGQMERKIDIKRDWHKRNNIIFRLVGGVCVCVCAGESR